MISPSSCLTKPKKRKVGEHSMEIESKFILGLSVLHIFENRSIGPLSLWTGWMPLSEYWTPRNAIACMWMPLSKCEQPPNTHWVHMNANEWEWAASEHHWVHMNACAHSLSACECHWFTIECDSPWCDHEKEHLCVEIELPLNLIKCVWTPLSECYHPLNAIEGTWMHLSEYWMPCNAIECAWMHWVSVNSLWTPIECAWMPMSESEQPLNTLECAWMPMSESEQPLKTIECTWTHENTHWVCANAIELLLNATHRGVTMRKNAFVWELNSLWTWMSVHEHLWVSLNTPWMLLHMRECLCVSIEHPLNVIECTWMPLSECDQPMNTHWVHVNAFE
jgi:hypothetical protein